MCGNLIGALIELRLVLANEYLYIMIINRYE